MMYGEYVKSEADHLLDRAKDAMTYRFYEQANANCNEILLRYPKSRQAKEVLKLQQLMKEEKEHFNEFYFKNLLYESERINTFDSLDFKLTKISEINHMLELIDSWQRTYCQYQFSDTNSINKQLSFKEVLEDFQQKMFPVMRNKFGQLIQYHYASKYGISVDYLCRTDDRVLVMSRPSFVDEKDSLIGVVKTEIIPILSKLRFKELHFKNCMQCLQTIAKESISIDHDHSIICQPENRFVNLENSSYDQEDISFINPIHFQRVPLR
ncbi:MAG: hypothetical protein AAF990_04160 [Bacteroidota bacterium]